MKRSLLVTCLAVPFLTGATVAPVGGTLTVEVLNVRNAKGHVHVEVCTQATFMKECPYFAVAPSVKGTTTVSVPGVPVGVYAVQAFLDENSDNKVNRGLFGIPKEGVGFSNDALKGFSAPKWEDAKFSFNGQARTIQLKLRYYL
ncbi:MAG TPA: DUF2141 domain-containing protein [Sphingobium sp.]|uniref:DUF2141 domain-containing protein n=1 Tax=Sphingobium sp. TaxID=1912891 RepID=UPI002ED290F6